jgi:hypothetical protein
MKKNLALFLLFASIISIVSCRKEKSDSMETLRKLYKEYKNGEIDCAYYGTEKVFRASENAYDAPTIIYNSDGEKIATCNYAFGDVDAICDDIIFDRVVYRCRHHISGENFIDVYGLSRW